MDRATALDREERYADARAMLDELDAFIVAERAANKSDAPARRLAAWLAATWKEEREEAAIDEAIEGSHLVSFLDDGALDAIGTGTERSMAATADDVPAPAPVAPAAAAPPPPTPATSTRAAEVGSPAPTPARRRWLIVGAALVIAGGALAAMKLGSRGTTAPADARPAVVTITVDAAVVAIAPPIDAELPDAPPPPPPPPDAAVEVHRPRPRPTTTVTPANTPPVETHTVTVTSKPWSYFTVDDAPLQHQTLEVIRLPPGPHVIHFTRDNVRKDVAIVVPGDDKLTVVQDMSH